MHPAAAWQRWLSRPLTWFVIASAVFLLFLGREPIRTDHERRVAETAATMARAGWPWQAAPIEMSTPAGDRLRANPWLVPVFENQTRLQKPPLPYWATALVFKLAGEGPASARLVPALLGVASVLLIGRLGRRVDGRQVGLLAMMAWTSMHFVVDEYRKAMADPYLAAFVLAAIVAWVEAAFAVTRRRAAWMIVAFYVALALGTLSKGPFVFLHVGLAIAAFTVAFRRWPAASVVWHFLGVVAWCAISLPWPIAVFNHVPNALGVWRSELDKDRNPRPFFFYLHSPFLMSVPWTYAWIAAVVLALGRRSRRLAFAQLWLGATILVFSFGHMKKNAYLLPAAPAIAIACAQAASLGIAFARLRRRPDQVRLVSLLHTLAGIGLAIAIGVLAIQRHRAGGLAAAIIVAAVALLVSIAPLLIRAERAFATWLKLQAFAFAVLVLLFISFPQADKPDRVRGTIATQPATHPIDDPAALTTTAPFR